MSDEMKCEIIRDLLPLYVDGITNEVTNEAVENHINHCEQCKKSLECMMASENKKNYEKKEIDYLKRIKKSNSRKMLIGIFSAVILITGVFVWKVFIHGFTISASTLDYSVIITGNNLILNGSILNSGEGFSHIKASEDEGIINLTVYTAPINIFRQSGDFKETFQLSEDVKTVYLGDLIIYQNGQIIPRKVAQLYNAKTPYIGDISASLKVAQALEIDNYMGSFTSKLKTSKEPYEWILNFDERPEYDDRVLSDKIFSYSCIMLATIDNLDSVSWHFKDTSVTETVNSEHASHFAKKDIKKCASSAEELKKLMVKRGIYK